MLSFETLDREGHEEVIFFADSSCGLKAIVAIHDTTLGPALGGTRMWPYVNSEEALCDVLRLSRGMTYKASISGLNLGGGKAVIIGEPDKIKSEALLRSYGRYLESLNGRYITAEDVNMGVSDIEHIFTETDNVTGVSQVHGGSGNPAPYTALGVFRGIEASCLKVFGNRSVQGRTVALQGVGSVGHDLGELLIKAGTKVFICDINKDNIRSFKDKFPDVEEIDVNDIYDMPCDIYSPCALGATINDNTIDRLKCKIVAGAANNQLAEGHHGQMLKDKNILYVTDYLINAGGLMNVSIEFEGWSDRKSKRMVNRIYDTVLDILKFSEKENMPICQATDLLAEKRIASVKKIQRRFLGKHTQFSRKRVSFI